MVLNHEEISQLLDQGVVENGQYGAINGASLDIHLGETALVEVIGVRDTVNYAARQPLMMREVSIADGLALAPGEFILAHTVERFNLPADICAEYKLKSSMARIGLEHLNAGWCDPTWHGSVLTLELKNMTRYHTILLKPGDAIGQMIFRRMQPVFASHSYANVGRYNQDASVSGIKQ